MPKKIETIIIEGRPVEFDTSYSGEFEVSASAVNDMSLGSIIKAIRDYQVRTGADAMLMEFRREDDVERDVYGDLSVGIEVNIDLPWQESRTLIAYLVDQEPIPIWTVINSSIAMNANQVRRTLDRVLKRFSVRPMQIKGMHDGRYVTAGNLAKDWEINALLEDGSTTALKRLSLGVRWQADERQGTQRTRIGIGAATTSFLTPLNLPARRLAELPC